MRRFLSLSLTFWILSQFSFSQSTERINISSAGHLTYYCDKNLDFSSVSGVSAFIITAFDSSTGELTKEQVYDVPAKTGILLEGNSGYHEIPVCESSNAHYDNNMLVGTLEAITIQETDDVYKNYYLSNGNDGVGFYKVNGSVSLSANRAYLRVPIDWTVINVATAGTLPSLIGEDQKNTITSLKITGSLNGTDILFLREMAGNDYNNYTTDGKLTALDLSGATIVSGGDNYYNGTNCCTEDNIIGPYMFYGCKLSTLKLPNSITEIKNYAINYMRYLTSLDFGTGVRVLGSYSVANNDKLEQLTIPNNVTTLGANVFNGNNKLKSIILSDNITVIPDHAFTNCYLLENFTLPSQLSGIGPNAFQYCRKLTNMELPNSIQTISSYAFYDCELLESITLPNALNVIDSYAFGGCSKLQSIELPATVTSIGEYAFSGCYVLANIQIPNSVTSIGDYAFRGCKGFTEIIIPNGVTTISGNIFNNCENLAKVILPSSVTTIGNYAFYNCTKLADINITSAITEIGEYAFSHCSSLTQFTIPSSITTLPQHVLEYSGLTTITIPSTVESIDERAFYHCGSLAEATIQEGVKKIDYQAFGSCANLQSITIPQSVTNLGSYILSDCSNLETVVVQCPMTKIPDYMFSECTKLTSLTLPEGLKSIGSHAFYKCSSLPNFQIPSTVTTIGNYAFSGCTSFTTITIPESVTIINDYTFSDCTQLATVNLPDALTQIENYSFYGCLALQTIKVPSTVTKIGDGAFYGCKALASFEWPENTTTVGYSVFQDCTSLASVSLSTGITRIGNHAFDGCSSLTGIDIPASVTAIGYYAFQESGLKSIIIPSQIKTIEEYTFNKCSDLNSVTFPEELTKIENDAFRYCTSLTSISIPASVTSIQYGAFSGCSSLVEVHVRIMSPLKISNSTFSGIAANNTLYVPDGCLTTYQNAEYWSAFANIVEEAEAGDGVPLDNVDWALLKQFYQGMETTGWTNKWEIAETAAATGPLKGVSMRNGHVIRISLPQNNMTGTLSSAIFMLPELQELDLSGNALEGDLSLLQNQLESLVEENTTFTSKLAYLDISNNLFSGNIGVVGQVLSQLTTLKASNCHISDVVPVLPETITTVELDNQTIDQEFSFDDLIADKELVEKMPTIWLYNSNSHRYDSSTTLYMNDDWENQYTSTQLILYLYNSSSGGNWYWHYYSDDEYKGANDALIYAKTSTNGDAHTMKVRFNFGDGDANMDGIVDVLDLQHIVNRVFGRGDVFNYTAANLIKDEVINVQDVIAMVNLMMENEIPTTSSTRMWTRAAEGEAGVVIATGNGQLTFDAKVPISSFDLTVECEGAEDLDLTPLAEMGLQYRVQRKGNLTRIIAYSLTGGFIPIGQTVIAMGKMSQVVSAKCANSEARPVRMNSLMNFTGLNALTGGLEVYVNEGQIVLESQNGHNHTEWQLYSLSGHLIDSGVIEYLNAGRTVLGTFIPYQVILRVKTGKETIVKKLSNR